MRGDASHCAQPAALHEARDAAWAREIGHRPCAAGGGDPAASERHQRGRRSRDLGRSDGQPADAEPGPPQIAAVSYARVEDDGKQKVVVMNVSRESLVGIVEKSACLLERIGPRFVPRELHTNEESLVAQRMTRWRRNASVGNEEQFERRLAWDGLTADRARAIATGVRLADRIRNCRRGPRRLLRRWRDTTRFRRNANFWIQPSRTPLSA